MAYGYLRSQLDFSQRLSQAETHMRAYATSHGIRLERIFLERSCNSMQRERRHFPSLAFAVKAAPGSGVLLPTPDHLSLDASIADGFIRQLDEAGAWIEYTERAD